MTPAVHGFVKNFVELNCLADKHCLDVGSLDVCGSVADLFTDYTGVDMRSGKNVNKVMNSHRLLFDGESFEVVCCLDMLEHDDQPFETVEEIYRVLKPRGFAIVTVPYIGHEKHDHPNDYWRFTAEAVKVLFKKFTVVHLDEDEPRQHVHFVGQKPTYD